jgi:Cft2 family RNA processing exonuclease
MNATETEEPVDPSDKLMFLCLGGGNEVGRSCHIIQYKGKTVMVRCSAYFQYFHEDLTLHSSMLASIQATTALLLSLSTTIST